MDNSNMPRIKIGLSLFTDIEDREMMENINRLMEIPPTSCTLKGEPRHNTKNAYYNCSTWYYSTDYVYCLHLEDVVNLLLHLFEDKVSCIKMFEEKYQMGALIDVCIVFGKEVIPSMMLDSSFISFANNINATIDIDCYKQ